MNQENQNRVGRTLLGYLIGTILAVLWPLLMITELMSLMAVIMLPAICMVFILRWSGRLPAIYSAMMLLVFSARYMGEVFLWVSFFSSVLPVLVLERSKSSPFFVQVRRSICAFGAGIVLSVATVYAEFGGDLIRRAFARLETALQLLPADALAGLASSYAAISGIEIGAEGFSAMFAEMMSALIPVYQLNLPGLILSGALITGVLCACINVRLSPEVAEDRENGLVPLREWYLPASATAGLLLLAAAAFLLSKLGVEGGNGALQASLSILATAFCIQTLSSAARRTYAAKLSRGSQTGIAVFIALLSMFGANTYSAIYGCASAVFGSKGALRQYAKQQKDD